MILKSSKSSSSEKEQSVIPISVKVFPKDLAIQEVRDSVRVWIPIEGARSKDQHLKSETYFTLQGLVIVTHPLIKIIVLHGSLGVSIDRKINIFSLRDPDETQQKLHGVPKSGRGWENKDDIPCTTIGHKQFK